MKRVLLTLVVLAAAQIILVGLYFAVEASREPTPNVISEPTRPNVELGEFEFQRPDGSTTAMKDFKGKRVVLHLWATWCPPCLDEIPSLLEYADSGELPVIAASVDPEWSSVREFLGGPVPSSVVLADGAKVQDQLGIVELPATLIVDENGITRLRYEGPQDWSSADLRAEVRLPTP